MRVLAPGAPRFYVRCLPAKAPSPVHPTCETRPSLHFRPLISLTCLHCPNALSCARRSRTHPRSERGEPPGRPPVSTPHPARTCPPPTAHPHHAFLPCRRMLAHLCPSPVHSLPLRMSADRPACKMLLARTRVQAQGTGVGGAAMHAWLTVVPTCWMAGPPGTRLERPAGSAAPRAPALRAVTPRPRRRRRPPLPHRAAGPPARDSCGSVAWTASARLRRSLQGRQRPGQGRDSGAVGEQARAVDERVHARVQGPAGGSTAVVRGAARRSGQAAHPARRGAPTRPRAPGARRPRRPASPAGAASRQSRMACQQQGPAGVEGRPAGGLPCPAARGARPPPAACPPAPTCTARSSRAVRWRRSIPSSSCLRGGAHAHST